MLANPAVLVGIYLATALTPWISAQVSGARSALSGSDAPLLSVSTGLLALVTGITQLMNATGSARIILLLQEKMIENNTLGRTDTSLQEKS